MISRLNHVNVFVLDQDRAKTFYTEALGFESLGSFSSRFRALVGRSPTEYRAAAVAAGGVPPIPGCVVLMWTRPHPDDPQSGRSAGSPTAATVGAEPHPKEHR